ncbi:MAG: heme exporter protein CcmD [Alphaproteobacteria bacterium]
MSHAFFITASYALVVIDFGALVVDAARRHAAAKRLLAELDPRGDLP